MIDAHCHLQDVQSWKAKNTYVCNGYDLPSSIRAVEIANSNPQVFAAIGLGYGSGYPDLEEAKKELVRLAASPLVVAVGESGLDEKDIQVELFDFHVQLAKDLDLPLVVHSRGTLPQIYSKMKRPDLPAGRQVQMHCWTGEWDWAKKFLDLGCYLSFGGITTFKSSGYLREVVRKVPPNRLLIETDSPYISPTLDQVAKVIAKERNMSIPELDQLTAVNALQLFPKLKLASLM